MKHTLAHPHKKVQLFPNYLFVYKYRDWPYDKQKIINAIDEEEKQQTKRIESGVAETMKGNGLVEGDFDFLKKSDKYPIINKLNDFFHEAIADVITHALPTEDPAYALKKDVKEISPMIFESWYHKTNSSGYHSLHCHPGSSWAGIFYVHTKDCGLQNGNGINRWANVNSFWGPGDLGSHWWNGPSIYGIEPDEGTLVLFPAWMYHEATPYQGTDDRYVIAFNSVVLEGQHND